MSIPFFKPPMDESCRSSRVDPHCRTRVRPAGPPSAPPSLTMASHLLRFPAAARSSSSSSSSHFRTTAGPALVGTPAPRARTRRCVITAVPPARGRASWVVGTGSSFFTTRETMQRAGKTRRAAARAAAAGRSVAVRASADIDAEDDASAPPSSSSSSEEVSVSVSVSESPSAADGDAAASAEDSGGLNLPAAAISIGVGIAVRYVVPIPAALDDKAWSLLAIFMSTVTGLVIKPAPVGAWAFMVGGGGRCRPTVC